MRLPLWRRLARNRLLDAVAVFWLLLGLFLIGRMLPARANQIDFSHYYVSSRLLLEGHNPYRLSLAELYRQHSFVIEEDRAILRATNPPPLLCLFAPLAMLPPATAFALWVGVQALSLAAILGLTRQLLGQRLSGRGFLFLCAAAVCCAPVYWHFYYSQLQLLLAALVLGACVLQQRQRETAACLLVTAAGLLKLFPLLLLPWFVWGRDGNPRRRWQRLVAAGALVAGTVAATGPVLWRDFFQHGLAEVAGWTVNRQSNFSLPSFLMNLGYAAHDFAPPSATAAAWWTAGLVAGAAAIAACYPWCWRNRADAEREFSLLTVAMLAGNPVTWGNYFVFLLYPLAALATRLAARPTAGRVAWFAAVVLLLNTQGEVAHPLWDRHLMLKVLVNYLPLYGLLTLGWHLAREGRAEEHRDT